MSKKEKTEPKKDTETLPPTEPDETNPTAAGPVEEPFVADAQTLLEQKVAELQDKLLRQQADFDNSRKRLQREKEDAIRFANESLLADLLAVVDNFELGLQAAETATDAKSIALGMTMVKTQLQRFLTDAGVQEINALGQKFDPYQHEAIGQVESAEHPEGTVLGQQRKGYKLRDRLLRPATVTVAHPPATPESGKI